MFISALSCGPPGNITHGWHAGDCYTLGCGVFYHCAEGYEVVGASEILCQPSGTWSSEPPSCICKLSSRIIIFLYEK